MRYENMKPDMSGSLAKNRTRIEVLWGLDQLLEQMRGDKDFAVVFDYLCDIELHLEDSIEFQQVKTKEGDHFSFGWLCNAREGKSPVIVTLYRLKEIEEPGKVTKLFIVANRPLMIDRKRVTPTPDLFPFEEFPEKAREKIRESVAHSLGVDARQIDFTDVSYLYEELPLGERAKNDVLGKLVSVYEEVRGEDCAHPSALFRALSDLATDRASVEKEQDNLEAVIANKGITRSEVERMFDQHRSKSDRALERAIRWVEDLPPASQRGLKATIADLAKVRLRTSLWDDVCTCTRRVLDDPGNSSLGETELIELIASTCPELSTVEMQGTVKTAWAALSLFHCVEE